MTLRFILAVTDFSVHGDNALHRAALLGAQHGAVLRLAYLAYPGEARPADATSRLVHHALQLSHAYGIEAHASSRRARSVEELMPEARSVDLVVWGAAPVHSLRSFFLGQPVEELIRAARRPVLATRRSAKHSYRSLLVAVDFSEASGVLVDIASLLSKTASIELFHAINTATERKLRYASVSEPAICAYRDQARRDAQGKIGSLSDLFGAQRYRVRSTIVHGHPVKQALREQQRSGSELVVVGKQPSSTLTDLIFPSVASQILCFSANDDTRPDVLIVPHDWQPASKAAAASRLTAERSATQRVRAGAPHAPRGPNPAAVLAKA